MCIRDRFLTLFSNNATISSAYVADVLQLFFLEGWKIVFRVALAVVSALQHRLLTSDFEQIMSLLRFPLRDVMRAFPTSDSLLRRAYSFKVTNRLLRQMQRRFNATQ